MSIPAKNAGETSYASQGNTPVQKGINMAFAADTARPFPHLAPFGTIMR